MKVIIAGSRGITDIMQVYAAVRESGFEISEVVCGGARGVDTLGYWWAMHHNVPVAWFQADWKKYGTQAGYLRNQQMANYGEALIAIWNGHSRGTQHMIHLAQQKGLKVHIRLVGKTGL